MFLFLMLLCTTANSQPTLSPFYWPKSDVEMTDSAIFDYTTLRRAKAAILLDFTGRKAMPISQADVDRKIKEDNYSEVSAKFSQRGIIVQLTFKRQNIPFLFDPKFPGQLQMDSLSLPFKTTLQPVSDLYSTDDTRPKVYINQNLGFCNVNYSVAIIAGHNFPNKLGLDFISRFDWIIDFRERKVYCRKNCIAMQTGTEFNQPYGVSIIDGKIIVVHKNVKMNNFRIGDSVISVDGDTITDANVREKLPLIENGIAVGRLTFKSQ